MAHKTTLLLARLLFIAYMFGVGYVCFAHIGPDSIPHFTLFGIRSDKYVHFLLFVPSAILLYFSSGSHSKRWQESLKITVGLVLLGAVVAAATEYVQGLLPYRSRDIHDLYADWLGVAAGAVPVLLTDLKAHRHKKSSK